jgi:hypothetical protein
MKVPEVETEGELLIHNLMSLSRLFLHHIQMGQISPVASHRWGLLLLGVRDRQAEIQPSKL